jgi:beta-lactamase superfamily II metal-dependent hydrolase
MKKLFALLLAAVLCFGAVGCQPKEDVEKLEPLPVTGPLEVAVLQIGKADAIVITTQNKTMVIDTGESDDGGKVLNYLNEKGLTSVDYLLVTHYDRDHVGGADRMLNFVEVKEVIRPDYVGVREEYETFLYAIEELQVKDTALKPGSADMTFMMDDVEVLINSPAKSEYVDDEGIQLDNNFSLVVRLRHGAKVLLFAGDCEDLRLAELITSKTTSWRADFLKVPYHGNYTEMTTSFLSKVIPTYAVICDSDKNPAAPETLSLLEGMEAEVFQTLNGTVVCQSDGTNLVVTQTPSKE